MDAAPARGGVRALRQLVASAPGLTGAATALAWLYLYSVLWLAAYAVLTSVVFGWRPVVITGGSMAPGISRGDVVMLAQVQDPVGRGAVITFTDRARGGELVTHRVTQVLAGGYRTRGDANPVEDSDPVATADVRGTGRLLVPLLGKPVSWLHRGAVLPLLLWVGGSIGALALVRRSPDGGEPATPTAPRPSRRSPAPGGAPDVLPQAAAPARGLTRV